ncbi:MAG: DNA polymerase III subunit gamma/tau, partial [bacterium]
NQKNLVSSLGDKLREALAEKLGEVVKLDFEMAAETTASPAAARAREQAARQDEALAALRDDPFVQTLVRECDATLSNIRPLADTIRMTGTHP